ncbi:unnamed protein product [Didymodactylos carnosus]|uniref:Uncharacterized protein n=1 Tax=Didymodactylos carnosus TaxID=1234261 RepID=A0A813YY30_9BILA|nr:unnamed protein product [Didymodactylos carnosus]CAF3675030.1 unnamed protein product [Didymodactylos carnosus]
MCINRWIVDEKKKTCPQCRDIVTFKQIIKKLFLTEPLFQTQEANVESSELLIRIDTLSYELREKESKINKLISDSSKLEKTVQTLNDEKSKLQKQVNELKSQKHIIQEQLKYTESSKKKVDELQNTVKLVQSKLQEYRNVELILKGSTGDFEVEMKKLNDRKESVRDKNLLIEELARYTVILKQEYNKVLEDKQHVMKHLDRVTAEAEKFKIQNKELIAVDKRHSLKRRMDEVENEKKEIEIYKKEIESQKQRVKLLETLIMNDVSSTQSPETKSLARRLLNESPTSNSVNQKVRKRIAGIKQRQQQKLPIPMIESDDDDVDEVDHNMVDLTNVKTGKQSNDDANSQNKIISNNSVMNQPTNSCDLMLADENFQTSLSAIDILHDIIKQNDLEQPLLKKQKKSSNNDDDDFLSSDFIIRPHNVVKNKNYNALGGHDMMMGGWKRTPSANSFQNKSQQKGKKKQTSLVKNNSKITGYFLSS